MCISELSGAKTPGTDLQRCEKIDMDRVSLHHILDKWASAWERNRLKRRTPTVKGSGGSVKLWGATCAFKGKVSEWSPLSYDDKFLPDGSGFSKMTTIGHKGSLNGLMSIKMSWIICYIIFLNLSTSCKGRFVSSWISWRKVTLMKGRAQCECYHAHTPVVTSTGWCMSRHTEHMDRRRTHTQNRFQNVGLYMTW